jgi:hypothetical protein
LERQARALQRPIGELVALTERAIDRDSLRAMLETFSDAELVAYVSHLEALDPEGAEMWRALPQRLADAFLDGRLGDDALDRLREAHRAGDLWTAIAEALRDLDGDG